MDDGSGVEDEEWPLDGDHPVDLEVIPDWAVRLEVDGVIPIERPLFILDAASR